MVILSPKCVILPHFGDIWSWSKEGVVPCQREWGVYSPYPSHPERVCLVPGPNIHRFVINYTVLVRNTPFCDKLHRFRGFGPVFGPGPNNEVVPCPGYQGDDSPWTPSTPSHLFGPGTKDWVILSRKCDKFTVFGFYHGNVINSPFSVLFGPWTKECGPGHPFVGESPPPHPLLARAILWTPCQTNEGGTSKPRFCDKLRENGGFASRIWVF